jgi:tetratricopeptide (TPR) repeat protein
MKSFACYCQKCRAANLPGDDLCVNCGTPLMLVVVPLSVRNESIWDAYSEEHLLERISHLELRLMQVTDRLSKVLDLMLKQSKTVESEHLLVETLIDALGAAKVIEDGQVSRLWRERQAAEERKQTASARRETVRERALGDGQNTKIDLFTHLVKDGFRLIENGDDAQGLRTLERAAAMSPENFPLLSYIGEHYYRHDKRALARDYLAKAHAVAPDEARNKFLLGIVLLEAGEIEKAKDLLESFGEKSGFAVNFPLGVIYAAEKRFDAALAAFKRASASQNSAESDYALGSVYAELKRDKLALRHFQKAVESDRNFADAWYMLASILLKTGDEQNAKDAIAMALAATDAGAQCFAVLKNPRKTPAVSIEGALLFARFSALDKNVLSALPPRFVRLLRQEIEKTLASFN